jgi:hypothetical protein
MSVESDTVAALLAHAPLAALVANRFAPDKVPQGIARPYVVYIVERKPEHTLLGLAGTWYHFKLQAWADTRTECETVADAIEAALTAGTAVLLLEPLGIPVESRDVIAEHELDLEGTEIAFDRFIDA